MIGNKTEKNRKLRTNKIFPVETLGLGLMIIILSSQKALLLIMLFFIKYNCIDCRIEMNVFQITIFASVIEHTRASLFNISFW